MATKNKAQFHLYKDSVVKFFSDREKWEAIYPYVNGEKFSRRFFEHFITEFSRSKCCQYPLKDPSTGETYIFNVYHSAQSVLMGVHKRFMDPFCRKTKGEANNGFFKFGFGKKVCEVAVCELLFFRWALTHKVLDYVNEHEAEIKADMAKMAQMKRSKQPQTQRVMNEFTVRSDGDEYWRASIESKMQQPKRARKRYRGSNVETIVNEDIQVVSSFNVN